MTITPDEIKRIAHLSKLGLTEADIANYSNSLSNIFNLVSELQAVDTHNILPYSHPLEANQRLRADQVTEHPDRDKYLELAPKHAAGLYLVPQVIE